VAFVGYVVYSAAAMPAARADAPREAVGGPSARDRAVYAASAAAAGRRPPRPASPA
jgi:hypothetical protein